MKLNQDLKLLMDYQEEVQREKIKSLIAVQVEEMLKAGKAVRDKEWKNADVEWLNTQFFLTAKPVVYLVNVGAKEYVA
jgi:obg-like ATPase 1